MERRRELRNGFLVDEEFSCRAIDCFANNEFKNSGIEEPVG
jgi:hypothetical protein